MSLKLVTYSPGTCIRCGGEDGYELAVGGVVQIFLNTARNSAFPESINGIVVAVDQASVTDTTRTYTVQYESEDLPEGVEELAACDISSLICTSWEAIFNAWVTDILASPLDYFASTTGTGPMVFATNPVFQTGFRLGALYASLTNTDASPILGYNVIANSSTAGRVDHAGDGAAGGLMFHPTAGIFLFGNTTQNAGTLAISNGDNSHQHFRFAQNGHISFGPSDVGADARYFVIKNAGQFNALILKAGGDNADGNMEAGTIVKHDRTYTGTSGFSGVFQLYGMAQNQNYCGVELGDSAFVDAATPYTPSTGSVACGSVQITLGPVIPDGYHTRFNYDKSTLVGRYVVRSIDASPGITQSGTTITAAEGAFVSADLGRYVEWSNFSAGGQARHVDKILEVLSGTTVRVALSRTIATGHPAQIVEFHVETQVDGSRYGILKLGKQNAIYGVSQGFEFRPLADGGLQSLYLFGAYTDNANLETFALRPALAAFGDDNVLLADQAGTGTDRGITVATTGTAPVRFATSNLWRWSILSGGDLVPVGDPSSDNVLDIGSSSARVKAVYAVRHYYTATVFDAAGSGTPEGAVVAGIGSTFRRTDGGAGTSFYVKESGTGNTGWVAK